MTLIGKLTNRFYQLEMENHGHSSVLLKAPLGVMAISICSAVFNLYRFPYSSVWH